MAKLRKGVAYRRLERPYTRKSKYRKKSFVRANPNSHIVKYQMGDTRREFPHTVSLICEQDVQLRHNALEAARKTTNRLLETKLGKNGYHLRIRAIPHHILRENPLASGAGADRMSTGMKMSFGKSVGIAAQMRKGQTIIDIDCEEKDIPVAKRAAQRANHKFPCQTSVRVD